MRGNLPRFIPFLLLSASTFCFSAEIYVTGDEYNDAPVIQISGEIVKGDLDRVKSALREVILSPQYRYLHVYLNSPGGDVFEAMEIGQLLRSLLVKTYAVGFVYYNKESNAGIDAAKFLEENPQSSFLLKRSVFLGRDEQIPEEFIGRCYSACLLVFYSGVERDSSDNGYFSDPASNIPVIGFHRPYFDRSAYAELSPDEAQKAYLDLENMVSEYLSRMGASNVVIEKMLQTPSTEIELVSHETFKVLYERKEPFFDEWLIAKCGSVSEYEGILNTEDALFMNEVTSAKRAEASKYSVEEYIEVYRNFMPEGRSREKYESLLSLVRSTNLATNSCRELAIFEHQADWATNSD